MNIGMMWFNNDPKTPLISKVLEAAEYYQNKYGRPADTCLVHPDMLAEAQLQVGKITVKPLRSILPGHLWIGVDTPDAKGTSGEGSAEQMEVANASL